jgi:hypothetical protein
VTFLSGIRSAAKNYCPVIRNIIIDNNILEKSSNLKYLGKGVIYKLDEDLNKKMNKFNRRT